MVVKVEAVPKTFKNNILKQEHDHLISMGYCKSNCRNKRVCAMGRRSIQDWEKIFLSLWKEKQEDIRWSKTQEGKEWLKKIWKQN